MTSTTGPSPEPAAADPCELDADELTDLLLRLLTDDEFRNGLARDGASAIARNRAELGCLATIDQDELEYTARRFRGNLWSGDAGAGISAAFPRSLELLARVGWNRERLMAAFLRSPEFTQYRALPYTGEGISLEEAFGRFATGLSGDANSGDSPDEIAGGHALSSTLAHEMLMALLTALVHEAPVAFRTDLAQIMPTTHGYAAVHHHPPALLATWRGTDHPAGQAVEEGRELVPCLYSSTPRGLAFGPVSPYTAEALTIPGHPAADEVRQALLKRGLW
ncbi:hypothetical protein [Streptomyces violascens]|uniref:hypothetical protein n=1 Tax=Streptomyces violascens TaxID=67381 RepID=UPI00365561FD